MILEEEIAGGVALYDASEDLPRREDRYRDPDGIARLYVHHSGRLGRPGFDGVFNSARYVVVQRGFPGPAYTFWVPYAGEYDDQGRRVLYRCNPDNVRSWHTGGDANRHGVACCLQGNTNKREISPHQIECLEALIPWCVERYGLEMPGGLSWHSEAAKYGGRPKRACPGVSAEAWLRGWRERALPIRRLNNP